MRTEQNCKNLSQSDGKKQPMSGLPWPVKRNHILSRFWKQPWRELVGNFLISFSMARVGTTVTTTTTTNTNNSGGSSSNKTWIGVIMVGFDDWFQFVGEVYMPAFLLSGHGFDALQDSLRCRVLFLFIYSFKYHILTLRSDNLFQVRDRLVMTAAVALMLLFPFVLVFSEYFSSREEQMMPHIDCCGWQ